MPTPIHELRIISVLLSLAVILIPTRAFGQGAMRKSVGAGTVLQIGCTENLGPANETDFGWCARVHFEAEAKVVTEGEVQKVVCQLRWHAYECDPNRPANLAKKDNEFTECKSPDSDWTTVFVGQRGETVRVVSTGKIHWTATQVKSDQEQASADQEFLTDIKWQVISKRDNHIDTAWAKATIKSIEIEVTSSTPSPMEVSVPLQIFASSAFETMRDTAGLKNIKYDMVGCDYAVDAQGHIVPSIGVFVETEHHAEKSSGYLLIHTDLIPVLAGGKLTFQQKTVVADFRIKVGGWGEWVNNIVRVISIGRMDLRVEDFVAAFARDEVLHQLAGANARADELLQKIKAGGLINSITITQNDIVASFGAPGNGPARFGFSVEQSVQTGSGKINPIYEWVPKGHSKDDAALVVTLFFDAMQLHSIASVNNGDPTKVGDGKLCGWFSSDLKNRGENRVVLYLPEGFSAPDLSSDSAQFGPTEWHNWDDKIGSLIVRPGKKYAGQRLRLGENPATNKDQGMVKEFGVGYFSLAALYDGKLFGHDKKVGVSQLSVVK